DRAQVYGTGWWLCSKPGKPQETSLSSSYRIGRHTRHPSPGKVAGVRVAAGRSHPISGIMQHLDLCDDEAALIKELADITGNDRSPFSSRIQTLRANLAKLRPEPVREPSPPPKVYEPPRATSARRRWAGREARGDTPSRCQFRLFAAKGSRELGLF